MAGIAFEPLCVEWSGVFTPAVVPSFVCTPAFVTLTEVFVSDVLPTDSKVSVGVLTAIGVEPYPYPGSKDFVTAAEYKNV